jgi:hypothetical protein
VPFKTRSSVWSSAAAAFVIGIIAVLYTQWFKAPAAAFAVCAILPLLPGVLLYQGLLGINGLTSLVNALGTALALAGGLTFGEYVMSVLWRQLRLVENRFFAPLFAKPFATQHRKSGRGKEEKIASDLRALLPRRPRSLEPRYRTGPLYRADASGEAWWVYYC